MGSLVLHRWEQSFPKMGYFSAAIGKPRRRGPCSDSRRKAAPTRLAVARVSRVSEIWVRQIFHDFEEMFEERVNRGLSAKRFISRYSK